MGHQYSSKNVLPYVTKDKAIVLFESFNSSTWIWRPMESLRCWHLILVLWKTWHVVLYWYYTWCWQLKVNSLPVERILYTVSSGKAPLIPQSDDPIHMIPSNKFTKEMSINASISTCASMKSQPLYYYQASTLFSQLGYLRRQCGLPIPRAN